MIIFKGSPAANIKQFIVDNYATPSAHFTVQTTSNYKKSGIYSAWRDDTTKPVVIDWGDGTVEQVNGDVSQKAHEYATVGTFKATISNIKTFTANVINSTWYNTTSQNAYTLIEVVLSPCVTSIGSYAFYWCRNLTSVTISDGMTSIEQSAFSNCNSLTSVTIGNSVTSIGSSAFYSCSGLTSMTIPDSVTSIESSAFKSCLSLTSVTIPASVTSIGEAAFYSCISLTSITIPNSVTSVGSSAFYDCSDLTSITFEGKTISQVNAMSNKYWGLNSGCIITCTDGTITVS